MSRFDFIQQHLAEHGFDIWQEQGLAYMVCELHGGFLFCPYCAQPFPKVPPQQELGFPEPTVLKIER